MFCQITFTNRLIVASITLPKNCRLMIYWWSTLSLRHFQVFMHLKAFFWNERSITSTSIHATRCMGPNMTKKYRISSSELVHLTYLWILVLASLQLIRLYSRGCVLNGWNSSQKYIWSYSDNNPNFTFPVSRWEHPIQSHSSWKLYGGDGPIRSTWTLLEVELLSSLIESSGFIMQSSVLCSQSIRIMPLSKVNVIP